MFTIDELNYLLSAMASEEDNWCTGERERYKEFHDALVAKIESEIQRVESKPSERINS